MFTDSMAIDFFVNDAILAKINAEEDSMLAQRMHISGYPTGVLINPNETEIDRIVGYAETEEYIGTLQNYMQGIGTLNDLLGKAADSVDRELYYEIADKYKYRGQLEAAEEWFNKVIAEGEATDEMSGQARFAMADMYRRANDYPEALEAYSAIVTDFEGTDLAMDADIYRAITFRYMGDTTAAISAFKEYIDKYPESEDIEYAKRQISILSNPPAPEDEAAE